MTPPPPPPAPTPPPYGTWVRGNRWDTAPRAAPRRVSVIVPHYEQPGELARTLAALARQDHPDLEVIVADDGSAAAPVVPAGVRLVRQADLGFRAAAARNLGAAAASGDVLVFLDADTTPEPGFVSAVSRLVDALPEAVVVGRRRHADLAGVPVDAPIETAGPARELAEPAWLVDGHRRSRDLLDADDRSYRYVISAVLACSRWLFDELGGFDETFVGYGGEDWEWAHRAWLAGAVLAHAPDAVAWHDGPDRAGRDVGDPGARAAATAETRRLAAAIPVAGSRPRGLWTSRPDIVVDARLPATDAARFVTVDALLEALPEATIVVTSGAGLADQRVVEASPAARVTVTLEHPLAFLGDAGARFADAVRSLGVGERGGLTLRSADGAVLARAESSRARARRVRWGTAAAFETVDLVLDGAVGVGPEPDLEAWLGGWAGPGRLA